LIAKEFLLKCERLLGGFRWRWKFFGVGGREICSSDCFGLICIVRGILMYFVVVID